MSQVYLEYSFLVKPLSLGNEILIAELGYVGFESFVEDYQGLKAYIQKKRVE
jgi:ribosomal protein L11 methyltransferase